MVIQLLNNTNKLMLSQARHRLLGCAQCLVMFVQDKLELSTGSTVMNSFFLFCCCFVFENIFIQTNCITFLD